MKKVALISSLVLAFFFAVSCVMRPAQYERDMEHIRQAPETPIATPAPRLEPPAASASPPVPQRQQEDREDLSGRDSEAETYDYFYFYTPEGVEYRRKLRD